MSVGWVAAGATLVTGVMSSNATSDAADAQADAANNATQMSYQQYRDQVELAAKAGAELTNIANEYASRAGDFISSATNASKTGVAAAGDTMQQTLNTVLSLYSGEASKWEDIFGPVMDNLSSFYSNLTPAMLATTGLEAQQKEFQAAQAQVQKQFAQRGITGGAQQLIETQMQIDNARARADIRRDAELQVPELQQNFAKNMSNVVNPYLAGEISTTAALGQNKAQTQLSLAQLEANKQLSLGDVEAQRSQALADAAKTRYNVASSASANYSSALQANALAQGKISSEATLAQSQNLTNTLNTGLSVFAKYYKPQTEQQQMLNNQWS